MNVSNTNAGISGSDQTVIAVYPFIFSVLLCGFEHHMTYEMDFSDRLADRESETETETETESPAMVTGSR